MKGRLAQVHSPARVGSRATTPEGAFIVLDGEDFYRISSYSRMTPFLMSLASDSDLWMFITSGGGLTAGRVDADGSLFPYLTVDQLHTAQHHTGPLTLIRVEQENAVSILWEPFATGTTDSPAIERNLYKNTTGNRLVFEEINHDLGLAFHYAWTGSEEFGWVRSATLENRTSSPLQATILDGLRNILPYGAPLSLYQQASILVNAYKKNEVDAETGLGIFSLTAGITDRTEALEVLKANTVWCCGLDDFRTHLSLDAVESFRRGQVISEENVLNGTSGNYLISSSLYLEPEEYSQWHLVADVGRDHLQIAQLRHDLLNDADLFGQIEKSLKRTGENLRRNVCCADGLQVTGNLMPSSHHFANVLFNNMRGGIFDHNYDLPVSDFADFLQVRNHDVASRHESILNRMPGTTTIQNLCEAARQTGDTNFERLCYEYLPLHFGRRHGDPSRPWNQFSISVRNGDGKRELNYQGNWRDIFQNWEALSTAFPGFLPNIVAKFVNASTVDGFNPYRITRNGVDWEEATPDDPWSNIGYWGDHQIVYLLQLLESLNQHEPKVISSMFAKEIFSYAEVPYTIKPYAEILEDPKSSIAFDGLRAKSIAARVAKKGTDGKLLTHQDGSVYQVNFLEKLLIPALAKLSNMIPDAGIWMNTQRPEWNDANNALGGGGVSVVTLCYLRQYLVFLAEMMEKEPHSSLPISTEVAEWGARISTVLGNERSMLEGTTLNSKKRKKLQDALGKAFSDYRGTVYAHGFSGKTDVSTKAITTLCHTALEYIEWGIRANRRDDGLYHAYNLLEYTSDNTAVNVIHLQEMLEGQVAVLNSGVLKPQEALQVLEQLFASDIYRADQNSFMLYPEAKLPGFLDKNLIPTAKAEAIALLDSLLNAENHSIIARENDGTCRFNGSFQNSQDVAAALDNLENQNSWSTAVAIDREAVLALFEDVFQHKSYTGRSGVMYGYEGLGCIYWHMVAKLLLAVQKIVLQARRDNQPQDLQGSLAEMYFRIRSGLGYEKSVAEYGAFPADPYSHTSPDGVAKQPGMTGQVKEEILTRRGELGIGVEAGQLSFQPVLLRSREFIGKSREFNYFDIGGKSRSIALPERSLAFTICQVPVIYMRVDGRAGLQVVFTDGSTTKRDGTKLNALLSKEIFTRSGQIDRIILDIPEEMLG